MSEVKSGTQARAEALYASDRAAQLKTGAEVSAERFRRRADGMEVARDLGLDVRERAERLAKILGLDNDAREVIQEALQAADDAY